MKSPKQLHHIMKSAMACDKRGDREGAKRILDMLTTKELEVCMKALSSHMKSLSSHMKEKGIPMADLKLGI